MDVYRKIGRGGAGNYYNASNKPADTAPRDLEAQDTSPPPPAPPSNLPSAPARAGRGGAGNFLDPSTQDSSAAAEQERKVADQTAAAVRQHPAKAPALSGRGGAGNWRNEAAEQEAKKTEEERGVGEELERKAREVVDQGLKMPEKVHHAVEKAKG